MHSVHESPISFQEAVLAEVMCRSGSLLLGLSLLVYKMGTMIMFPTIRATEEGGCLHCCDVVSPNEPCHRAWCPLVLLGAWSPSQTSPPPWCSTLLCPPSFLPTNLTQACSAVGLPQFGRRAEQKKKKKNGLSLLEQTVREKRNHRGKRGCSEPEKPQLNCPLLVLGFRSPSWGWTW